MKEQINRLMDWFEDHFNFIIELIALIGGVFMIMMSLVVFVVLLIDATNLPDIFEIIIPPGAIGFFGVCILFALRITRHLTK